MRIKLETTLDYFIFFIIFIKIIFAITYFGDVISQHTNNYTINQILDPRFIYWKERTEFLFIACMSILLIYHFKLNLGESFSKILIPFSFFIKLIIK